MRDAKASMCIFSYQSSNNALANTKNFTYLPFMYGEIVTNLEQRAADVGMSVSELCRLGGVSRSTFTRWKSGHTSPTGRILERLDAVLKEEPTRPAAE